MVRARRHGRWRGPPGRGRALHPTAGGVPRVTRENGREGDGGGVLRITKRGCIVRLNVETISHVRRPRRCWQVRVAKSKKIVFRNDAAPARELAIPGSERRRETAGRCESTASRQ